MNPNNRLELGLGLGLERVDDVWCAPDIPNIRRIWIYVLKLQTQHTNTRSFNRIALHANENAEYTEWCISYWKHFEQKSYRTPTGGNSIGSAAIIHTHDACVQRCKTGRSATQTHERSARETERKRDAIAGWKKKNRLSPAFNKFVSQIRN